MDVIGHDDSITAITDKAHAEDWAGIHTSGFCRACANVYTVLNHAAVDNRGAVDPTWLASNEAFEVAWRGAQACGVGKVSPAQLTAALNALSHHLGGR